MSDWLYIRNQLKPTARTLHELRRNGQVMAQLVDMLDERVNFEPVINQDGAQIVNDSGTPVTTRVIN